MNEPHDERYKWLRTERIGITICKCPKCGYETEAPIIKDLVSGHYLAHYCPCCGEPMERLPTINDTRGDRMEVCEYDEAFTRAEMFEETGRCKDCRLDCPNRGKE